MNPSTLFYLAMTPSDNTTRYVASEGLVSHTCILSFSICMCNSFFIGFWCPEAQLQHQPPSTPSPQPKSYSVPSAVNSSTFTFQGRLEILFISEILFRPTGIGDPIPGGWKTIPSSLVTNLKKPHDKSNPTRNKKTKMQMGNRSKKTQKQENG